MADKKISALTASSTPLAGTEVLPIVQGGSTVKVSVANLTAGRSVAASALGLNTTPSAWLSSWKAVDVEDGGASLFGSLALAGVSCNAYLDSSVAWRYKSSYAAAYIQMGSDGRITFENAPTGTAGAVATFTERMRVTPAGNITVSTGDLVIGTAGKGIDFSANTHAAGMTSELLTWYEEGTFTPTFTGFTVGNGSVFGFYRRIGKQVFVTYGFILGSTSAVGSLTGLSGLPFTTGTVGASRFFNATGVAFKQGVGGFPAYGLIYSASTTGSGPASTNTNTGMSATAPFVWATDDSLSFTATYFVD